ATFVGVMIACMNIIGWVLGGPMFGGLYAMFLKKKRGQPITFGDAFVGFNLFVPLMLAYIVMGLLCSLGFLFCILPGIYLAVAWLFTLPLVIDKKLDFWAAMELSRKMVNKHWWGILGFLLVCGLINIAGLLAGCIGVFVTLPVTLAATACAYDDIFGTTG
ncbi:MAG: glycerophosphoryl diester phosphodiesterase membrane domain-containing protein, partial [Verrucomicrobiae bacterium]|nr:glycerophosphoryl diester phosphodiesterase membrane domain-containing protein [Verrucomicrobiae bacterium]